MGGSLGSVNINKSLRSILSDLLKDYQVVHICGKGNIDNTLQVLNGYTQFEFLNEELPHVFSISDLVISRAGTNSMFELLTLKKVCLFIPLSTTASRGEQILNAEYAVKNGFSQMLTEGDLNNEVFLDKIKDLFEKKEHHKANISKYTLPDGTAEIMKLINFYCKEEHNNAKPK
jgi:UDP-N-acetylglucosamine--N-acetylmuramyl-(pentapeptide) pyrophosphoryl-undecaprenol N-acetylglucosamine transferase